MVPRIVLSRPATLERLWIASLAAAAAVVLLLAWFAGSDPAAAGDAQALAEARGLLPLLSARGDGLEKALAAGDGPLPERLAFRLDAAGRLNDPMPPPAPRVLRDAVANPAAGAPGLAALKIAEAQGQVRAGRAAQALATLDSAEADLLEGEWASAVRLNLERAAILVADSRPRQAANLLERVRADQALDMVLPDGRVLGLVVAERLAAALTADGRVDEARAVREQLLFQLLDGRLPLPPSRAWFEAGLVAAKLDRELPAAGAARLADVARLDETLQAGPPGAVMAVGADALAFVEPGSGSGRGGRLYDRTLVAALFVAAWREILPAHGAFALLPVAEAAAAGRTVLGAVHGPAALGMERRLVLADPEVFAGPARRRRAFLLTAAMLVVGALAAVGWLGARALRRNAALDRMRREFIAGISHELRTPAAAIALLADNLAEGRVADPARLNEYYGALRRDADRLQRLVADVLDVSAIERGSFRLETDDTDPAALLRGIAEEHRARLGDAGLDLELILEDDLPRLRLDVDAVERALANLLENARKYAAEGGLVRVTASRAELDAGQTVLCVAVEDRGPGIAEDWRARVFETFQRGPAEPAAGGNGAAANGRAAAGAGLGLALVKEIMAAHAGGVTLGPGEGGVGARFVLSFPVEAAPRELAEAPDPAAESAAEEPPDEDSAA
ncbi:MAG TPA: HAMP domain-containing sensor histidine kinase [Planctomycetota bacterium]